MSESPDLFLSTAKGKDENIVAYLNKLFLYALESGGSDIHFEATDSGWNVRLRRSGVLEEIGSTSNENGKMMTQKIRAKARMEAMNRGQSMDGRFSLVWRNVVDNDGVTKTLSADVRVSVMPTERGQSVVCRVLDQRNATRDFRTIKMPEDVRSSIRTLIEEPDGLFLVTGPTGSGKTSTLYSILGELNTPQRKILTIEDPVEYKVPGLQQVPVGTNNTFPDALRAALRQDPDVILVGEIRDAETARVAVQAASTGHLVLSTLHTNDAPSSIMRMIDLGVDAFTLGTCLRGVLAQRLVPAIAGAPRYVDPTHEEKIWLHGAGVRDLDAKVCMPQHDEDMGGRIPVMELIMVNMGMRNAMSSNDLKAIRLSASEQPQYRTLAQAGVEMCRRGLTTLESVRAISSNMDIDKRKLRIGERLVADGVITNRQLERALEVQISGRSTGDTSRLGEVLVRMGFCTSEDIEARAASYA